MDLNLSSAKNMYNYIYKKYILMKFINVYDASENLYTNPEYTDIQIKPNLDQFRGKVLTV